MNERTTTSSVDLDTRARAEVIAAALESANLVVLVSALAHITRDETWLTRFPVDAFDHGRRPGSLSEAEAAEIRAGALEVLLALGTHDVVLGDEPIADDLLQQIMDFCAGEAIGAEYRELVREEGDFDGRDLRRPEWSDRPPPDVPAGFRVGIVGSGFGGLCAAVRLGQLGIPYTAFEKNVAVGGTWHENDYPDLRVDVPNHFYSFSFAPNPDWSDHYARRAEIRDYIEQCADDYGVRRNIRFETEVVAADYDEARCRWVLTLRGPGGEERVEVNALISAVGMLNRPSVPDLEGLDTFAGTWFHSSHWDHDLDLTGKRVAVVGTGASAMQLGPAIAPDVERLAIFQRSRHWVISNPNYHRSVADGEKWLFRHMPSYLGWHRFLQLWNSSDRMYPAFRVDPAWEDRDRSISLANEKMRRAMTWHIHDQLGDRVDLIERVVPDYPPLGKRMLQDNGWYRMLLRDNVDLVTDGIVRITPRGILTEAGEEHVFDVIVLATGFHPNKFLWPMEITAGRERLHDVWGEDPRAYLGITVPGFPNLFCLYGPNTNPLVGSVIIMLELQVAYVMKCIAALVEGGYASMECRRDVHDDYNERVDAEHEHMIWRHPRVHSYYNNSKGRVTTQAPWRLVEYWRMTREPDLSEFLLVPSPGSDNES